MVERLTSKNKAHGAGSIPFGWVAYKNNELVSIPEMIEEELEDSARVVAMTLGFSPTDVEKMNVYAFFRDLNRAIKIQEAQKKNLEKWNK